MAFPNDAGHTDFAASGYLIPTVWSPRVLEKYYEFSVLEHIANTDYEGEIRAYGDKVKIRVRPDIDIKDYQAGQDLDLQRPDQTGVELVIDRGKYWNFLVEDVNAAQSDMAYMEDWTSDAAEAMNESINETVLSVIPGQVHADNQGAEAGTKTGYFNLGTVAAPLQITVDNAIDIIGNAGAVLSEQKRPETGRWMTIPPWFKTMIFNSSLRNALVQGNDQELLRKGHVGTLNGFELFETNQLVMAGDPAVTSIMFGHIKSLTFASQLVNSEVIRSERVFGRFARGLNVFGFNTLAPRGLGLIRALKST